MDTEKKREIIMKHYSNPKNRKLPEEEGYEKVNTANSSCVDNLDIYVKIENNKIKDITFMGEACAISISSTSIMINNLIGKSTNEAYHYIEQFESMVSESSYDKELLGDANAYFDIASQGHRKTCALLPYIGIKKILETYRKEK